MCCTYAILFLGCCSRVGTISFIVKGTRDTLVCVVVQVREWFHYLHVFNNVVGLSFRCVGIIGSTVFMYYIPI